MVTALNLGGLTRRVIPCLDVTGGRVVKGVNFVDLRDAGDPVELAAFYDHAGADEDRAEEDDVPEERERLEQQRDRQPAHVCMRDPADAVADGAVGARQGGHQRGDHERGQRADQDRARDSRPPGAGQTYRCNERGHVSIVPFGGGTHIGPEVDQRSS